MWIHWSSSALFQLSPVNFISEHEQSLCSYPRSSYQWHGGKDRIRRVTYIGAFMANLCHICASRLKCRKKINPKSLKAATQQVTTVATESPEEFSRLQNFTLPLRHNSTKLHPKWLLMTKTFNGKEPACAQKGGNKAVIERWIWCAGYIEIMDRKQDWGRYLMELLSP